MIPKAILNLKDYLMHQKFIWNIIYVLAFLKSHFLTSMYSVNKSNLLHRLLIYECEVHFAKINFVYSGSHDKERGS